MFTKSTKKSETECKLAPHASTCNHCLAVLVSEADFTAVHPSSVIDV